MATATVNDNVSVTKQIDTSEIEPLLRLNKDLKQAARTMGLRQARWLVDEYYTIQDNRIRANHQRRTSEESGEPHRLIEWLFEQNRRYENDIKIALGEFAKEYRVGRWLQSMHGIGPVLSAAMLSYFDIRGRMTAGCFWRFAGLDPSVRWVGKKEAEVAIKQAIEHRVQNGASKRIADWDEEDLFSLIEEVAAIGGTVNPNRLYERATTDKEGAPIAPTATTIMRALVRRPHNADLKSICAFKMGEVFVKFSKNEKCLYGVLYAGKKNEITSKNEAGFYAATAKAELEKWGARAKQWERYKYWTQGKLAPSNVHERARRYAVKIFLSHLHGAMYNDYYNAPIPKPWIVQNDPQHTHVINPLEPFDRNAPGRSLKALYSED